MTADRPDTLLVLLAAGGGSRFTGPMHKLRALVGTETVAAASLRHALRSGVGHVLLVTGAEQLGDVVDDVVRTEGGSVSVLHHPGWEDGQATTIHAAITEADRRGVDVVVIGLADQPFVEPDAWRRVAASDSPIAVATYDGRRRNPVRLHRDIWPLLPDAGDEGARTLFRVRPELVEEIPCPGSAVDIDTLEDIESWQKRSSTSSR